ncbi:type II secretion system protein E [Methanoculleus taiwanensis]|uniref:Type II secretion system protein E n=1 Tax=Methanoculleus taiwanensis TaxID=1550565 RepID=A0A498H5M6_9EURY|nr:type II secretion system protein E [Methanoculleus taiwanensis]RXE57238.1 type II secretion system protein E [Methanoculleus taiwanensis]
MVMRCSFALDPDLMEQIDQFAKDRSLERNEAILDLIEAGLAHFQNGEAVTVKQQRSFEEINALKKDMEGVKSILDELRKEVRLVHHTIETDWNNQAKGVPFQTKHPWEFWR